MSMIRRCTKCKKFIEVEKPNKNGLQRCGKCKRVTQKKQKIAQAAWRKKRPHYFQAYRYKASEETIAKMKSQQAGRCAICARTSQLVVDHNHTTGVIRGLLCINCNFGLGLFQDNQELLEVAAKYIRFFSHKKNNDAPCEIVNFPNKIAK